MLLQSLMFNIAIKEIFQMVQTFSDLILLVFFFSAGNVLFFCQNSFTAALRSNKGDISNGQHCLLLVTVTVAYLENLQDTSVDILHITLNK